jgi:hypothetical protein
MLLCFLIDMALGGGMRLFSLTGCGRKNLTDDDWPGAVEADVSGCLFQDLHAVMVGNGSMGGVIILGPISTQNDHWIVPYRSLRVAFCEFVGCSAAVGGGVAAMAGNYTVEFTTSTRCVATQAGAFCWLRADPRRIAVITYVRASLSETPEGSIFCHCGMDAGSVTVTGLNSSFNHAQLASGYYIGRHLTLSIADCFFHSNTDGNCLRLSYGGMKGLSNLMEDVKVTCVSFVNNTCVVPNSQGGLVWFRADAIFTSCLFMENMIGEDCPMFQTCFDSDCLAEDWVVLFGQLTLRQCIFDTDNVSVSGLDLFARPPTSIDCVVVPPGYEFAPCGTRSPTQTISRTPTASPEPTASPVATGTSSAPWSQSDQFTESHRPQSMTFTAHWEALLFRKVFVRIGWFTLFITIL